MTPLAFTALIAILPVVLGLFAVLPARRAVLVSYILAWLFLPQAGFEFTGIPDFNKMTATTVSVFLGIMIFDLGRVTQFRFHWFDVPVLIWCLCPMISSPLNGLGIYDGLSATLDHTIVWGLAYLTGRLYFYDIDGLHELGIAILIGVLLYVPLCLYEIRMSPQLHRMVYGFHQHDFVQTRRAGGYRPMVFLQHGLALGLWMCVGALIAIIFWWHKTQKYLGRVPMGVVAVGLLGIAVLCKSTGALLLLFVVLGAYFASRWISPRLIVLLIALSVPAYLVGRIGGNFAGDTVVALLSPVAPEQRLSSLEFRLDAENTLRDRILQSPLYGWSRIDRVQTENRSVKAVDSMWIITFAKYGLIGLASYVTMLTLPLVMVVWRIPLNFWRLPMGGVLMAMALSLGIYNIDKMVNAMTNPILLLVAGGITALACMHEFRTVMVPGRGRGLAMVRLPAYVAG